MRNSLTLVVTTLCMMSTVMLSASKTARAESVSYVDKLGRIVSITLPIKRAVLFETYELSAGLGVWDKIAGISRYAFDNDLMLAVKPDIAKVIPSVGWGGDVNIEALLKLRPDLVLTWTFKPETVRFMEEKGLKVITIYPESLPELYQALRLQGRLFGKGKRVENMIAKMDKIFKIIKDRVGKIPPEKRKKAIWINGKPTTVSGGIGVNSDIFSLINGINPAASVRERSADVSIERIIAWNPEIIFIWGSARYSPEDLFADPQWRHIDAVKNNRVYKAPRWSTWSPRLAIIALWMAMKTYPDSFRDVDLQKTADEFYRQVYGIPYNKVTRIED